VLQTSDAMSVEACGGDPFGMWRLVELEIGRTEIVVALNGTEVGRCDTMLERTEQTVPRVLIDLESGGSTRQYAAGFAFTQSWSNGCVTDKASALRCSDDVWTGVSGCALDCDICRCDSSVPAVRDDGSWLRTETTLTLALWGNAVVYDYCVSGDRLVLSAPNIYLAFEKAYTFGVPAPCTERSSEQCTSGSGCTVGVCEGSAGCSGRASESECLTVQGCTWNAAACSGTGSTTCGLEDYGVAPGCDFIDQPLRCSGTVPTCEERTSATCTDGDGCTAEDTNICSGGTFDCSEFIACPIGDCTFDNNSSTCIGSSRCEQVTTRPDCDAVNENLLSPRCSWTANFTCTGTAKTCTSYTPEACESVPGCVLEPVAAQ
jgi:hypothetical protein